MKARVLAMPMGMGGDTNLPPGVFDDLAEEVGAPPSVGHNIDRAIFRGCKVVSVLPLPRAGSDHHAVLVIVRLPSGDIVRILMWNVWAGHFPNHVYDSLVEMIADHDPHIIQLSEAYRLAGVLASLHRYQVFQLEPQDTKADVDERPACVTLVRDDVKVLRHGWVHNLRWWKGPKHDLSHNGRIWPFLRLRFRHGGRLRWLGLHLSTGGVDGPNREAVAEQIGNATTWAGRP